MYLLYDTTETYIEHWRIQGGAAGTRPPQQDQFLSFLHTFLPKSVRVGGWRPPNGKSWIRHCRETRLQDIHATHKGILPT